MQVCVRVHTQLQRASRDSKRLQDSGPPAASPQKKSVIRLVFAGASATIFKILLTSVEIRLCLKNIFKLSRKSAQTFENI